MTRYLIITLLAALAACCQPANAGCVTGEWVSTAKTLHAVGNAAVVLGANAAVREFAPQAYADAPWVGLLPAIAVSATREYYKVHDNRPGHERHCEYTSMAYDAAGMAIGMAGSHWLLVPERHGVQIVYSASF